SRTPSRRISSESMPTSSHALILLRTYTRDASFSPARMTARRGGGFPLERGSGTPPGTSWRIAWAPHSPSRNRAGNLFHFFEVPGHAGLVGFGSDLEARDEEHHSLPPLARRHLPEEQQPLHRLARFQDEAAVVELVANRVQLFARLANA